ncbi:hypothetical protein V1514DRAFT_317245 [Lipomyces japonicus]|uniref:uncharacterized protein n=1 Tax=Lipomyces japonicus TaxID=56871 RepID=UPI0034CE4921
MSSRSPQSKNSATGPTRISKPAIPVKPAADPTAGNTISSFKINPRTLGYRLIIVSLPLLAISSYILYKREILGEPQRKREGFLTSDGIPVRYEDVKDDEK